MDPEARKVGGTRHPRALIAHVSRHPDQRYTPPQSQWLFESLNLVLMDREGSDTLSVRSGCSERSDHHIIRTNVQH